MNSDLDVDLNQYAAPFGISPLPGQAGSAALLWRAGKDLLITRLVVFLGVLARTAILLFLGAWMAGGRLWAGGSGLNIIVVVNQNSTNSLQLGNDYCERRGVPPQNVLRMTNWTGGSINWSPADFQNYLVNPLVAMVNGRGLTNQAQFVLLSMDIPYRVTDGNNENSTTAALFYGFKTNATDGLGSCSLPDDTSNSYAYSELPFRLATPNTAATNSFLAMMLTDVSLPNAENTLSRAVASDCSYPTQMVYLARTSDFPRSLRFTEFDNAVFENQVVGDDALHRIYTDSMDFTNLFGLQAGLQIYSLNTNTFVPGALGDTLTSWAGFILDPTAQTTALAYLEAGASGSYGTIVEPCAYTEKFPDPMDYFYQTRGFVLAEAYYQSVLNPFQGLFVGEPLAAPFARPGSATWDSLTNGAVLSGQFILCPQFTAAATNLPLSRVDLFVDGAFWATMTNLPPAAGNVLSVTLNGNAISYTVPTNATLAGIASGLANVLSQQSNVTQVLAFPVGDRIELQSTSIYVPGSNVTVSAGAAIGSAPALTTGLNAVRPTCLDTIATGYQYVEFGNAPQIGDWLAVSFTETNGVIVNLAVTNTVSGATIGDLVQDLIALIQSTSSLQSAGGVSVADYYDDESYPPNAEFFLYANTPGWPAAQLLADWTVSTNLLVNHIGPNSLTDNVSDLRPRSHLYVTSGMASLAVNFPCDTTQLSDGYHELAAVAYEGTSVATQTRVTRSVLVSNTGLSATLAALPAGTNGVLQFTVTATPAAIAQIELFGTGGSLGVVTGQSTATFTVSAGYLGLGVHPFYAVVTDLAGHRYQTQTLWSVVPAISLALTGPSLLSWAAIPGRQYDLEFTTNLAAGFQTLATITTSNGTVQWPVAATNPAAFFRVKLDP
jgi:uncharacterized protein (TIGR03790 family)